MDVKIANSHNWEPADIGSVYWFPPPNVSLQSSHVPSPAELFELIFPTLQSSCSFPGPLQEQHRFLCVLLPSPIHSHPSSMVVGARVSTLAFSTSPLPPVCPWIFHSQGITPPEHQPWWLWCLPLIPHLCRPLDGVPRQRQRAALQTEEEWRGKKRTK